MALTPYEGAEVDAPKLTPYTGEEVDPKAGPSRLRRLVADPAISALKGAIGLPEAAVGVADIATGGAAGKAAETLGFRPKEAKATLDTLYSPEQKAANQAVADAEGFLPTVGTALRNPSTIAHTVIESAPSILGGAGVARGLVRAGMGAATAAGIGEGMVSAGATAESIRQESKNGLIIGKQAAIAAGSGALTSALGVAGGRLAKRFGIADIDTALAGGADDAVKINPVKALAAGAASEGVFEEMPQSAQEQAASNLATGKPVTEGVSKAAATGALAGGVMGGGVASVKNLLAKSVGVSEARERIEAIPELPAEEQKPAVAELAAAVHPESAQAAVQMEAEVLDRLDAGEAVLESAPEPAAPTKEALVEALQEAVESGGELNPVEALQGKEEQQVLEALRKERPLTPEAIPVTTPEVRAQRWLTEGKTVTREGTPPDPEVAALLDDMGYTLTQGERADRKQGGSIARREWLVEKKVEEPVPVAGIPSVSREDAIAAKQQVVAELATAAPDSDRSAQLQVMLDQYNQIIGGEAQYQDFQPPVQAAPIKHKEQRQAFPDNPNLKVARENDAILIYDDAAFTRAKDMKDRGAMKESILGMARIKDGKFDGWVEGREPLSPQESVEYERVLKGHLGEVRFERKEAGNGDQNRLGQAGDTGDRRLRGAPEASGSGLLDGDNASGESQRRATDISHHLTPIISKLKVQVEVVSAASEIPGLSTDVEFTGVFLNGKIYLNAANLSSLEEAEAVLLQHEIRHAGLRAIFDRKGLDDLLAKTWGDLNSGVKAFAKERGIDTRSRDGKLEAAEEYIVELAKTEAQSPVWDRFVALFKALLRRVGLNLKLSDTELRWLVARSGEIIVEGALPGETGSRFAAAWHGTPHKFDKFSLSKIGTGEGAQAYGYGLYFAGSKAVAEYYREALRPNTPRSWRTTIAGVNIRDYPDAPGGLPMAKIGTALEAAGTVQGAIAEIENAAWATGEGGIKVQAKALEFLRTLPPDGEVVIEPVPDGHLYQVELAPDEDEYLRWDLSLGEQSKKIQDILEKAGYWDEETDGQTLYNLLKRQQNGDREASEHLHSLGIRGIKFPDGPSRNRPLKDIKAAFLAQLPEDAEFDDVTEMLGTGAFSAEQERLIRALEADDWLGFDYPAQAISAAMGKNLRGFDPSPELAAAVADLGKDMTYNYVIFNDEDVEIKARFARLSPKEIVTEVASRTELKLAKRVLSDVSGNVWYAVLPIDRAITFAQSLPLYDPLKKHLGDLLIHRRAKRAAANDPADAAYKLLRRVSTAFEDPYRTKIGGVFSHFTREGRAQADAAITTFNDLTSLATLYELRADGGLDGWTETSWKDQGKLKQTGKTLGQAQTEIKSLWAKLSKEQRIVQQEMIDHIKVVSDEVREARLIPYRQTFGEKMFAEAEAVAKQILTLDSKARVELKAATDGRVHRLALQIAEIRAERGLKGDFAPLMRFGDHVVRTFKGGKRIKTEIFESKLLAEKAAEKIKATPGLTTSYEKLSRQEKGTVNIPLDFMEDLRAAAEARGIKGDDLAALMDDFQAARVQTMPRATIAGNKLHREGVEGYSTDMLRAYAAYVSSAGRAIAQLKYGTKIEQTFRDMDNAIKAYQDPEGRWSVHAVERMSALKDRLYKMERMAATEKINEITKFLGKSTFLWFLTSPSVYAVQWAQPFMVTIPKMAARYGFSTAFKAYISEAKRFMAGEFSDEKIDAFNTLHENAGERLYQLIQEEREALPSEREGLRKAMMALYNGFDEKGKKLLILKVLGLQGELDLSLSHSMQDFVAGYAPSIGNPGETGFSAFHKAGNKITDQVMSKGAFFMQKSETGSRRAAAVSAFQLALGKKSDFAEANAYAADIISDTLGDFDSQNRPALMRGNVGRIIGQFQFFRLHMLGKVAQLFKDAHGAEFTRRIDAAKKSMKGQGFNVQTASANGVAQFRIMRAGESYFSTQKRETQPAEVQAFFNEIEEASRGKAEARKELSYMIGMSMALAGAGGTPIALAFSNSATSLIFSALALAFGDPDDPWEPEQEFHAAVREAMGDTMGNAFLMGLPSLVGMDVSKRIGMGGFADVLSGEPPPGISGTQKAQWYASRMLGPSFGLFSDSMRAFDALADGDLGEAMAVSSPKVVKDFIKATQLSEKGVTGIGGKTVIQPDDVAVTSLALQMVGINPAEVALAQQERREVAALSASLRTRRSLLMKRVTEATLDGDFEAREEALGAINEWGTKQPALMVTQKELLAAVKKGMRMRAGMLTAKEEMMQEKVRGL